MNLILNVESLCGKYHALLRGVGRPCLIHAECANSDCDCTTAQWPDAEERARVVLGSLESPSGGRKLHQAFGSNKLQWSQIQDFIVFVYIQRRYTKSRDYSATNKMTRWSGLLCERMEALWKGDIMRVARKCWEKRHRNAPDRDYPSSVRTRHLKVLYCMVSCIVSERLWLLSLPNYAKWKAG